MKGVRLRFDNHFDRSTHAAGEGIESFVNVVETERVRDERLHLQSPVGHERDGPFEIPHSFGLRAGDEQIPLDDLIELQRHRLVIDAVVANAPVLADNFQRLRRRVEELLADPARLAIGGWSWGGYVTLLAMGTRPDRWAAGIAGVPVGDYMGSYDDSAPALQAYDRSLVGGTVHERPEFVKERSPITYVDRVRAPVLVLVGEHDTRCVPAQVYSYVDALRAAGGAVELYSYDEGHSSYVVDEEVREWRTVLEFLLRHVPPS